VGHLGKFIAGLIVIILATTSAKAQTSYADDGLTRRDAQRLMAQNLFKIDPSVIDDDRLGAIYGYHDWQRPFSTPCSNASVGGHAGIDMQTADVAKPADGVRDRKFYALSSGRVVSTGGQYGAIVVYNSDDDMTTIYLHAKDFQVSQNNYVEFGDELGVQANIGLVDGNGNPEPANVREHVHIETRPGQRTGPACGAVNPKFPGGETADPVDHLYRKIVQEGTVDDERSKRVDLSAILPATISGASHYRRCSDDDFQLSFQIDTYSNIDDIAISATIFDTHRDETIKRIFIDQDDFDYVGSAGFRVGDTVQGRYSYNKEVPLSNSEERMLADRVLVRVYASNPGLTPKLGNYDDIDWENGYTMFIPNLLESSLGSYNSHYTDGRQEDAQRYIAVDTSRCN